MLNFIYIIRDIVYFHFNWGLGIGDWGLGIGDWAQSPIPMIIDILLIFLFFDSEFKKI